MGSFDTLQKSLVAELARIMLPATDTPGAIEAGVPDFVESMVWTWHTPGERRLFLAGLAELNDTANSRYKHDFVECSESQKTLLVRQLESASARITTTLLDPGEQRRLSFFSLLKTLVVVGFFSSEVGCTQVLRYLPGPVTYRGDFPIDAHHPQWS
jgi:glucoside 3-dehydrogenase (cytochrome c) hitch-hiker subunit